MNLGIGAEIRGAAVRKTACFFGLIVLALTVGGCRQAKTVKFGRVIVISEPESGADIFINGRKEALKTDASFKLKAGAYTFKLAKPNAAEPDQPAIGEAVVTVKAGQVQRLTIALNKMKIVPAAATGALRPESKGQKTVLDYYAALAAKDPQKAFAYLSRRAKSAQGGSYRFTKTAGLLASVKVVDLRVESVDPTSSVETDRVTLEVVKTPTRAQPTPGTERIQVLIATIDESGDIGLMKIDSIVDTSATPDI